MQFVHFLNLEYFILLVYRVFTGAPQADISQIPHETLTVMTYIGWVGLGLSVLFVAGLFFVRRAMFAVEHAGWEKRHEEEEALERRHTTEAPVNPRWERILMLAGGPSESDWRRAIIEADVMLADMLTVQGYVGESVGDKLKTANPLHFTTLDLAWEAHKMRNNIAHGGMEFHLTERETRATIDLYRRVFEEFNYL